MRICFFGTCCAEPTADNGYTSFLIEAGNQLLLVDASGNVVQSVLRAGRDPRSLRALVLTHHHADHIGGYPSLVQTLSCMGRHERLPVVCERAVRRRIRGFHELMDLDPPHCGFPVALSESFSAPDLQGLEVRLLPGNHSVPTSMVSVRHGGHCLLYTSDTAPGPGAAEAARGCDTLIHEATFPEQQAAEPAHAGHSSALAAGRAAAAAGVQRLFLCHICWYKYAHAGAPAEEAATAFTGEVIIPKPFRWYEAFG